MHNPKWSFIPRIISFFFLDVHHIPLSSPPFFDDVTSPDTLNKTNQTFALWLLIRLNKIVVKCTFCFNYNLDVSNLTSTSNDPRSRSIFSSSSRYSFLWFLLREKWNTKMLFTKERKATQFFSHHRFARKGKRRRRKMRNIYKSHNEFPSKPNQTTTFWLVLCSFWGCWRSWSKYFSLCWSQEGGGIMRVLHNFWDYREKKKLDNRLNLTEEWAAHPFNQHASPSANVCC